MGELLLGIVLIILSLVIYLKSGNLPNFNEGLLNAGSFPKLIAILLGILSLILVVSKVRQLLNQKLELSKMNLSDYLKEVYIEYKLVFFALSSFFLYIFFIKYIGFILTTISFIIVTGLIIGPKKKKDLLLITAVAVTITLIVYFFFKNVLHVRFPTGLFF